jgi:serine protease
MLLSGAPSVPDLDFPAEPPVDAGRPEFVRGELLVGFRPGASDHDIRGIYHAHGLQELERLYHGDLPGSVRRVAVPLQAADAVQQALARNPHVEYAEPNFVATTSLVPNDPFYSNQWNFQNPHLGGINVESAWNISTGSGVVVAVLDTGVAYADHQDSSGTYYAAPDLKGTRFVPGYDFINNDPYANDDHSHGTHVAGTIAQTTNNSRGVAGIAFDAAVMPVKVLNRDGSGSHSAIANGIKWAADQGAHVINLSLGATSGSNTLRDAVKYAYGKGATIVAAAGNSGVNGVNYPAAYDAYVIAVSATRYDGRLAPYSNYGSSIDVAAPGGDMNVDQNGDGYADGILQNTFNPSTKNTSQFGYYFFQGTSMASAHVSGVAAQIVSQLRATNGSAHPDQVRQILQSTARDMGPAGVDVYYGHGIIHAGAALQSIVPTNSAPIAGDDFAATQEEIPVTIHVLANDTDPDGDPLAVVSVSAPSRGSVVNHGDGTLTYRPNAGFVGIDTFSYDVADPAGATATGLVTITVESVSTQTLHVAKLDGRVGTQRNQWRAEVVIHVADGDGQPVAGAAVAGGWSDGRTFSGTTDAAGQLTAASRWLNRNTQSITLTVQNVTYSNWSFDSSNDTSITVQGDGTTTLLSSPLDAPYLPLGEEELLPGDGYSPIDDVHRPIDAANPPVDDVPPPADERLPDPLPPTRRLHNATNPLDVVGNGQIGPLDALVIITYLNAHGAGRVPDPVPGQQILHYLDTNGDDAITPEDVLLVIGHLNRHGTDTPGSSAPEGEAETQTALPISEMLEPVSDRWTEIIARLAEAAHARIPAAVAERIGVPWQRAVEALERVQERVPERAAKGIAGALLDLSMATDLEDVFDLVSSAIAARTSR